MNEELPSVVEFSINLKDQSEPDPLPSGRYTGTIRKAEIKESQRGTMYAAVSFHISPDQYPADFQDGSPDGLTIIYFGTKRFIESIGAPLAKKIDVVEWIGMEAALEVTHETYEGVNRAVINRVHAS